jgi:hypothetical protein
MGLKMQAYFSVDLLCLIHLTGYCWDQPLPDWQKNNIFFFDCFITFKIPGQDHESQIPVFLCSIQYLMQLPTNNELFCLQSFFLDWRDMQTGIIVQLPSQLIN